MVIYINCIMVEQKIVLIQNQNQNNYPQQFGINSKLRSAISMSTER